MNKDTDLSIVINQHIAKLNNKIDKLNKSIQEIDQDIRVLREGESRATRGYQYCSRVFNDVEKGGEL